MGAYPNIKKARTDRKMSQKEICEHLGMPQPQYLRYETGQREMPLHYLVDLAKFYNVSLDYLAGLTEEEKPLA